MADSGYVYALINPSMPNLVKIGKTERAPNERAQELSSSSGVPTQFVVAYSAFFQDCSAAENYLHQLLQEKGYRLSQNREFFSAPLQTVIDSILEAKKKLSTLPAASEQRNSSEEDVLKELKDGAAKGIPEAFHLLGQRYFYADLVTEDKQLAWEYFKEGARRGSGGSYAHLAIMLFSDGFNGPHERSDRYIDNIEKCWRIYFQSPAFQSNTYRDRSILATRYISEATKSYFPVRNTRALAGIKNEILELAEEQLKRRLAKYPKLEDSWKYQRRNIESIMTEVSPNDPAEAIENLDNSDFVEQLPHTPIDPWVDILKQAHEAESGEGKELQNPQKAQRLYREAGELGSGLAWSWLATMVLCGKGCNKDQQKALELYERAAQAGCQDAYTIMADIFLERQHFDNFQKCWGFFFQSPRFRRFTDKARYAVDYLGKVQNQKLPNKHLTLLIGLKEEILRYALVQAEKNELSSCSDAMRDYYCRRIRLVKESLFM